MSERSIRTLLLYATTDSRSLSYQQGWPKYFTRHPGFDCIPINLGDRSVAGRLRAHLRTRTSRVEATVMLHSVFSNAPYLDGAVAGAIAARSGPKAYFLSNEYKLMPAKMRFCERVGVSLLVTQSLDAAVHRLYEARLPGCRVIGIPNAGLDEEIFVPGPTLGRRPIDVGYRAEEGPIYLGHREREEIAERVVAAAGDLVLDISLDPANRFTPTEWSRFLGSCKAQLGCEAGSSYLDLDDSIRERVLAFVAENPGTTRDEIQRLFFGTTPSVSGRVLSGRVVEAAATGTAQILVEGSYGGYFEPDVHYVPVRRDLTDVPAALDRLRSDEIHEMVAAAQQVALGELTYRRLIDGFERELRAQLG
jgi:hypothetical protein